MKIWRLKAVQSLMIVMSFLFFSGYAHAIIIDNATAIPDDFVLLNFSNSGLDWVYAGPIAPNEFAPGNIQPASYRAAEGWRTATAAEWLARPDWDDFIKPGFENVVNPNGGFNNHDQYLFASEYWSDFTHVDLNDFAAGRVTDGVNGQLTGVPETIYIRNAAQIPVPATLALLMLGLAVMRFSRRK